MAVVAKATAKQQDQNDQQYQHFRFSSFSAAARRLLLEYLLDLANFILNLAANLFCGSFSFEVRVLRDLADFFLDLAFGLVQLSFEFIFCTWFHGFLSLLVCL